MYAKRLILHNFRSYPSLEIEFPSSSVFLTGPNSSGKTNIIEAIYYLTLGRSFRKADDTNLIQRGQKEASIYLEFYDEKDSLIHTISCVISSKGKLFAIDDDEVHKLSMILGKLIAVCYEPSQVFFFKDEPGVRRKLLDETLSQLYPGYLYSIGRYKKLLKERNAALSQSGDIDIINAYRNQLINVSYRIVYERKRLVLSINRIIQQIYTELFGENEGFQLQYKTNCPLDDDQKSFVENSIHLFESNKSLENIRGTTLIGPHRDNLIGLIGKKPIADYGSQGENRIASLALKFSLFHEIQQILDRSPILLLDDVTSDLDEERSRRILSYAEKSGQAFVTGTRLPQGLQNYTIYETSDTKSELSRRN